MIRLLALAFVFVGSAATIDEFYQVNEEYTDAYMELLHELSASGERIAELKSKLTTSDSDFAAAEKAYKEENLKLNSLLAEKNKLPSDLAELKTAKSQHAMNLEKAKDNAVKSKLFSSADEMSPENFVAKKSGLRAKAARIQREVVVLQDQIKQLKLQGDYPRLKRELSRTERSIGHTEKIISRKRAQIPQLKDQLDTENQKITALDEQIRAASRERNNLQGRLIPSSQKKLDDFSRLERTAKRALTDLQGQHKAQTGIENQAKHDLSRYSREKRSAQREKRVLESEVKRWKGQVDQLPKWQARKQKLKTEQIPAAEKKVRASNQQKQRADAELIQIKAIHKDAVARFKQEDSKFRDAKSALEKSKRRLDGFTREESQLKRNIEMAAKDEAAAQQASAELEKTVRMIKKQEVLLAEKKKRLGQIQGGLSPQEIAMLKKRITSKQGQLDTVEKSLNATKTEITQTQRQIKLACASARNKRICEKAKKRMKKLVEQQADKQATYDAIAKNKTKLEKELAAAEASPDTSGERTQLEAEVAAISRNLKFARRDRRKLKTKVDGLESKVSHLPGKRKRLVEVQSKIVELKSRVNTQASTFKSAQKSERAARSEKQKRTNELNQAQQALNAAKRFQNQSTKELRGFRVDLVEVDENVIAMEALKRKITVAESETLPTLIKQISNKEQKIQAATVKLSQEKEKTAKLLGQMDVKKKQLRKLRQDKSKQYAEITELKTRLQTAIRNIAEFSEAKTSSVANKSLLQAEISQSQTDLNDALARLPQLKSEKADAEKELKKYAANSIQPLEDKKVLAEKRKQKVLEDIETYSQLETLIAGFDRQMASYTKQIADTESRMISVENEIGRQRPVTEKAKLEWDTVLGRDAVVREELTELEAKMDAARTEFDRLEKLNDETLREVVR